MFKLTFPHGLNAPLHVLALGSIYLWIYTTFLDLFCTSGQYFCQQRAICHAGPLTGFQLSESMNSSAGAMQRCEAVDNLTSKMSMVSYRVSQEPHSPLKEF